MVGQIVGAVMEVGNAAKGRKAAHETARTDLLAAQRQRSQDHIAQSRASQQAAQQTVSKTGTGVDVMALVNGVFTGTKKPAGMDWGNGYGQ